LSDGKREVYITYENLSSKTSASSVVWASVEVLKAFSLPANGSQDPDVEVHAVRASSAGLRGVTMLYWGILVDRDLR